MSRIRARKPSAFALNKAITEKNLKRAAAMIATLRAENTRCVSEQKSQFRALYASTILKAVRRARRSARWDEAGLL